MLNLLKSLVIARGMVFLVVFIICCLLAYLPHQYATSQAIVQQKKIVEHSIENFVLPYLVSHQHLSLQLELKRLRNLMNLHSITIYDINQQVLAEVGSISIHEESQDFSQSISLEGTLLGYASFSIKRQRSYLIIFIIMLAVFISTIFICYITLRSTRSVSQIKLIKVPRHAFIVVCSIGDNPQAYEQIWQKYTQHLGSHCELCHGVIAECSADRVIMGFDSSTSAILVAWAAAVEWPKSAKADNLPIKSLLLTGPSTQAAIDAALGRIESFSKGSVLLDAELYQECQQDIVARPYHCDRTMTDNFIISDIPKLRPIISDHIEEILNPR